MNAIDEAIKQLPNFAEYEGLRKRAATELDRLRAHAYVWAGADPFTGEQVVNLLNENDKLRLHLASILQRNEELCESLDVACHIKADDKVSFDWAVLEELQTLRAALGEAVQLLSDFVVHGRHPRTMHQARAWLAKYPEADNGD